MIKSQYASHISENKPESDYIQVVAPDGIVTIKRDSLDFGVFYRLVDQDTGLQYVIWRGSRGIRLHLLEDFEP